MEFEFIYVHFYGYDWDDVIIFLSKEDAIKESIKHPKQRIKIFSKTNTSSRYTATYNYYKNGELILDL
jgi:hypothetical protein